MEEVAIKVNSVGKTFKLPHEKQSSLKSAFINVFRSKKGYEIQHALKDISLEIKKGEFFGIVGRNGSGKSTLLKLLAGIYEPTKGGIEVNGSLTPFIELGVGFNPELTGRENVFLNGALLGFSRKEMLAMYTDIVEFAEIEKFMDQKLKNYSSGMQVRLAFSIAIRAKSDILLLDEVLAVGDAAFQQKCYDYFLKLKAEKATVVFVSHDMGAITKFCDRAMLVDKGKIVFEGDTRDIASAYSLEANSQTIPTTHPEENKKLGIKLLGAKISSSDKVFSKGEKVEFIIHYELFRTQKIHLGISIVKDDVSIYECNTKSLELPSEKGKHQLGFFLPTDQLLSGLYKFNIAAFARPKFTLSAYLNNAETFYVQHDNKKVGGIVDLNSKWGVEK